MQTPPIPDNEIQRLSSLRALQILDTPPEERFDCITRLAKEFFGVPIALITLVEDRRQWFKSVIGLSVRETARDVSFCAHAMLTRELFIIPDALADERFADNPDVTGGPCIRFYAGCPLYALDGSALGTFCIIDRQPREFSISDQQVLRALGTRVETKINEANPLCQDESDVPVRTILESTERATMLTILQYQARHDPLTDLPNALFFGNNAQALLRRADIAMYEARRAHTKYLFYDASFDQYSPSRLALNAALRQAIADDTLQLYYQPKADAKTGAVRSVEALARWLRARTASLSSDAFPPLV